MAIFPDRVISRVGDTAWREGSSPIHQPNRLLGPGVEAGRWFSSSIAETIHGGGALCGDSNRFDLGLWEERGRIKGPFTHSLIDPEEQGRD